MSMVIMSWREEIWFQLIGGMKYICGYNELERRNMFTVIMNERKEICLWLQ